MDYPSRHSPSADRLWALVAQQHGVVARAQLLDAGMHPQAIKHRIAKGRLHPLFRGVYAVGRPQVGRHGSWMAAVLSCGPGAALSHGSAAALWEIGNERPGLIEVSIVGRGPRRRPGVIAHRRSPLLANEVTKHDGVPVTSPVRTLIDISCQVGRAQLERTINEADKLGLTDPEELRAAVAALPGQPGVAILRRILDRRTFVLTDSELERRFVTIACRAGLPPPQTQRIVNGFRVDFYWPELGLVVETDGLRYHRTPAQQAADRVRDQAHTAAGLTPLRFTHAQIAYERRHVESTLRATVGRLRAAHSVE